MRAAHHGQAAVVRVLVNHGADLNSVAKFNLTALMLAVIAGHAVIVDILVRSGADVNVTGTGAPGFDGKTALDLATGPGREHLERVLRGRQP
jgi:ankyrin repeat protein